MENITHYRNHILLGNTLLSWRMSAKDIYKTYIQQGSNIKKFHLFVNAFNYTDILEGFHLLIQTELLDSNSFSVIVHFIEDKDYLIAELESKTVDLDRLLSDRLTGRLQFCVETLRYRVMKYTGLDSDDSNIIQYNGGHKCKISFISHKHPIIFHVGKDKKSRNIYITIDNDYENYEEFKIIKGAI